MIHKFQIKNEWNDNDVEETNVYLDDELIYTVDKTLYAGVVRKNSELELCKILEEKIGVIITPKELSNARILESIDDGK